MQIKPRQECRINADNRWSLWRFFHFSRFHGTVAGESCWVRLEPQAILAPRLEKIAAVGALSLSLRDFLV
jgi:hypothetical protein